MTEQERSRRIFKVIVSLLFVSVILTGIFGWYIMQNVRVTARRTDLDMRCLAWASVAFACNNQGRFPTSREELFQVNPPPDSIDCAPAGESQNWPTTFAEAMRGETPPELDDAFRRLAMAFSSDGKLPPRIDPRGLPTLIDPPTKDTVREWLFTFPVSDD